MGVIVKGLLLASTSALSLAVGMCSALADNIGQPSTTETVVVTAEKRDEALQDTPVPVTVVDPDALTDKGQVLLRDWASTVPSLVVQPGPADQQVISIRGVSTGDTTGATAGVLLDDVPIGGSIGLGIAGEVPDVDPGDLKQIEVLRGPQGTLYGANAMGGLVKFETKDPSTDGFVGRFESGVQSVYNGNQYGYDVRGSANIPLDDNTAIRVSGFLRQTPGYIDDVFLNTKGVNVANADGARMSLLWAPSNTISLKLAATYQHTQAKDASNEVVVGPGLGDLQQNYVADSGGFDRTFQAYSATFKASIGDVNFTSITGYSDNNYAYSTDDTYALGQSLTLPKYGVDGTTFYTQSYLKKVSEEARFSGTLWDHLDWIGGAYYTREKSLYNLFLYPRNSFTGQTVSNSYWYYNNPATYEEYSAFANLTYHFTDQLDLQLGARESHEGFTNAPIYESGYFNTIIGLTDPSTTPAASAHSNTFTYLVTPSYKVSPDLLLYARIATGFRPGGPNNAALGVPSQYNPDKTTNYEVGLKGDLFSGAVTFDASLYYIDWTNIQFQLRTAQNLSYTGNGSGAKSEGVEVSLATKPWEGMTVSGWVSYDDAALTDPIANSPYVGAAGSRLPFSTEWSANLSAQQNFPIGRDTSGYVGAELGYVGDRLGLFQPSIQRQLYPAYTTFGLHAGVTYGDWDASVYVNNLTDERGQLNGGIGYNNPNAFIYIQPRTVGLSLVNKF